MLNCFVDTKLNVRFEIDIIYDFTNQTKMAEDKNKVAEFLHTKFMISLRDVFDLNFMNATEGKLFS